jgi:hypothetical protein
MEIPTGWAQVNLVFGGPGAPRGAQVVYGAQLVGGGALTTPQDYADFARTAWETDIHPGLMSGLIFVEARVKFGPNATGLDATATSNTAGGLAVSGEAPQVAVLIRKITAQGGRQGKGRMFLPGIPETSVSGGVVEQGTINVLDANFADWLAAHSLANFPVALLHQEAGISPFIVTEMFTQNIIATQRRRIRKVGGRRSVAP